MTKALWGAILIFTAQLSPLAAQPVEFDVASVKLVPSGQKLEGTLPWIVTPRVEGNRFRAVTSLSRLIEWAYDARDFQLVGGPDWIRTDESRYEILGTTVLEAATNAQFRGMVQHLLAERFQLKSHREERETRIYALVIGKSGPKLTPSKNPPKSTDQGLINIGKGELTARGATMNMFSQILTDNLERPVIDKTGLTGRYDFKLHYDPPPPGPVFVPMAEAIFDPIQELGLRIEPQRENVEFLVIESISRPSGN